MLSMPECPLYLVLARRLRLSLQVGCLKKLLAPGFWRCVPEPVKPGNSEIDTN